MPAPVATIPPLLLILISKVKALAALAVAVLLLLAAILLQAPPVRRYALEKAREQLRQQFDADLQLENLDLHLVGLYASAGPVTIRRASDPKAPPFFTARRASINVDVSAGLSLSIQSGAVDAPAIKVVIDEQGRSNLPEPPPATPAKDTGLPVVPIAGFQVRGGTFHFEDRRSATLVSLRGLDLDAKTRPDPFAYGFELKAGQPGEVASGTRKVAVEQLALAGWAARDGSITINRARLAGGGVSLGATGAVSGSEPPALHFTGDAVLPASLLEPTASGTVSAAWKLDGPSGDLRAEAEVHGAGLTARGYPPADLEAGVAWSEKQDRMEVPNFAIRSEAGNASGDASLALTAGESRLSARLNADLARAATAAGSATIPAASAAATLSAVWPALDFDKANGRVEATLTPAAQAPRNAIPLGGRIAARLTPAELIADLEGITAYATSTSGQIRVARPSGRIAGDLVTEAANVGDVRDAASPGSEQRLSGSALLNTALSGTLEAPIVKAALDAPSIAAGTLEGIAFHARAEYANRRATVIPVTVAWNGQRITGAAEIDTRPATPVITAGRVDGDRIALASILGGLGAKIPSQGTLALHAKVQGPWNRLRGGIDLTGAGLRARSNELGSLAAHATLDGPRVELTAFTLAQAEGGKLDAAGSLDLDSRLYKADANAVGFRTEWGEVKLSATGDGSLDDPAANGEIEVANAVYEERTLGDLRGTVRISGESATLNLAAPKFNIVAKANAAVEAPYDSSITIEAARTDLAALELRAGDGPVTGSLTGAIEAFGPLQNPRAMKGRARLSDLHAVAMGADIRNDGAIDVAYDRERITANALALRSVSSRISASGSFPLKSDGGSVAVKGEVDLAEWAPLIPAAHGYQASGKLIVDGEVRGSLERVDPSLDARLADGFFDSEKWNVAITQAGLEARFSGGVLHVARAEAAFGPASFRAEGDVPLAALPVDLPEWLPGKGSGPARFDASIEGLQLRAFRVLPEEVDSNIDLKFTGETPDVSKIEALRATLDVNPRDLAYGKFPLQSDAPLRAEVAGGKASIAPFVITGPKTRLEGRGSATLTGDITLSIGVDGATDAELVSLFTGSVRADGDLKLRASIAGTPQSPRVNGFFELTGGAARLVKSTPETPDVAASGLDARINFEGTRLAIERLAGQLNGGTVSGSGGFAFADSAISGSDLALSVKDVYLDSPAGLRTRSNADLRLLTPSPGRTMVIAGAVKIQEGSYTDDINIDQQVLDFLRAGRAGVELLEERSPFLEDLQFAVDIETEEPLILENNIGEMQLNADLRLGGTYYRPAVTGRLTAEEGGSLRLQGRTFDVERAGVTFVNETRIEPAIDVLARTEVKGKYEDYEVELLVTGGGARKLETKLTSEPALPEPDILALLTTGKTLEELQTGDVSAVARDQALSLVAGVASDRLSQGLERATGLSTVRIEPNLISTESTPGARLTVGQNITRELELIYSMNLAQSNDQIWIADYAVTRRFNTRAIKQADSSYRGEFRHDMRFGGVPEAPRKPDRDSRKVGQIRFDGSPGFPEKELLDQIKLRPGKKYDFFQVRKDLDRLREFYAGRGLLEARLQVRREEDQGAVSLVYAIQAGPRVEMAFENADVPRSVRNEVRQEWTDGLFDIQRTEDSAAVLRRWLAGKRHLAPVVTPLVREPEPGRKQVVFDVNPGPRFDTVALRFPGAATQSEAELVRQVEQAGLTGAARTNPAKVTAFVRDYYLRRGYLDVRVGNASPSLNEATRAAEIRFAVEEGERYRVESVAIDGNEALTSEQLLEGLPIEAGGIYSAEAREAATQKIEQQYWKLGYNDLDLRYQVTRGNGSGLAAVKFSIVENQRSVITSVKVEGADHTSESFVKKQIVLEQGLPVDFDLLGRSRRNLYDTGAYSLIEVEQQPAATTPTERDVAVTVRVRERRPFQIQYGAFYDTDRGPGVIADFTNRNSLGNARVVGIRTRYDGQIREIRGYFSQPYLQNLPVKTNFTGFVRQEIREGFTTERRGAEFIQELRFKHRFLLNYGFRFENTRVYERDPEDPDFAFDSTVRIAPINLTASRDTRDDLLDATRGSFLSQSFELAPLQIRDSLRYWRWFGQYFHYRALTAPAPVPLREGVKRPRVIYAGGVRAGVGRGIGGQDLIISERFFAGGGGSMRGFAQDTLGPVDFFGDPEGGEAVFITNQEVRFPMFSIFDGVGFVDIGNVYRRAADFSLGDLRKSAGVGLRVRTPYFLLRLDWGFKLDPKPGEERSKFFFSIGQAF
ncbi:MAG: translocation/assembly module TamB domain-containing protein [Bryobacteraceae bacterium]